MKKFVSDIHFENEYFSLLIRSPIAEGVLLGIDVPELPENCFFYSAKDVPGINKIEVFGSSIPIFAGPELNYKGESIGILVGNNLKTLYDVSKQFVIRAQSTPTEEFEKPIDFFDYPKFAHESRSYNNADGILDSADTIIYSSTVFEPQYHYFAELPIVKACPGNKTLSVYASSQWAAHVKKSVSEALKMPEKNIDFFSQAEGEALDGKIWFPSLMAAQVAVAAWLSGKPVSLGLSLKEYYAFAPKTPKIIIQHKTALSKNNEIEAMRTFILIEAGAYSPLIKIMISQMLAAANADYFIPAHTIEAIAVKSNDGMTDIFNGWGGAYVNNALEKHINEICSQLNVMPDEWRLKNMQHAAVKQYQNAKASAASVFSDLLKTVCQNSDFYRKYNVYNFLNSKREKRDPHAWRGTGIAIGFQYNGVQAIIDEGFTYAVEITLDTNSKIYVKTDTISETMQKILKKDIAKKLSVEENTIVFEEKEASAASLMTASAEIIIIPDLIDKCVKTIQGQRFRKPLPITVQKRYRKPRRAKTKDQAKDESFLSKTPAACAIELEMDPVCQDIQVKGVWLACMPGALYSKRAALTEIHKNIITALSKVNSEIIRKKTGVMQNNSIINAKDIPPIHIYLLESQSKPLGTNMIAEGIIHAAYLSALSQVLINTENHLIIAPSLTSNADNNEPLEETENEN
ncbi:molybdopterin cofactor-binding domain-containing protein [Treponema phagedenis]|uniref:Xanthine dehydrogenase family protein molybdopterin-binding subunit n=1 Tax=Treponema phagedenis TaxID=162 RepID=A0AAE6IWP8_TREPH|nr:molybdopterin cofactor-binding domain-containing protein [Treponema phagedenis]QEJ99385.1 xanthine dehydrogenase family protein molybdopterin-binding subunit [Treponema phagedenis]QEJ99892.1 xanthine dehydrogenase family protein molybdopterin-binding subunit [Treponema phagedenis]QEK04956.1 xanthine dehydrogenase family protein molybdopterin-binding subunit [Treponema phagedenis]QEK07425.1 xanthine dehydrogenase family protein molybdopterin-binding subunit [Treponema phagedenis]QEK10577.1 x